MSPVHRPRNISWHSVLRESKARFINLLYSDKLSLMVLHASDSGPKRTYLSPQVGLLIIKKWKAITPYDIESGQFSNALKEALKQVPEIQSWVAKFVNRIWKSRPPMELDWWYSRAASILHQLYTRVLSEFQSLDRYGGKKDRGMALRYSARVLEK